MNDDAEAAFQKASYVLLKAKKEGQKPDTVLLHLPDCVAEAVVLPDGRGWALTFHPGTHIKEACQAAWGMHVSTGQRMSFEFNDIPVAIGA